MKKTNLYSLILILSFFLLSNFGSYAVKYSIDISNFLFSPSNITSVRIGDTIHFQWTAGNHTTTSTSIPAGAAAWNQVMDATHLTFDYIPTIAGNYHYQCNIHVSMGMVGQFTVINSAGITDQVPAPKIILYPNPLRDRVYLNCSVQEGVSIQRLTIYDMSGKIVRQEQFNERSTLPGYLDLSNLHEGLMLFEFVDNLNRSFFVRAVRNN